MKKEDYKHNGNLTKLENEQEIKRIEANIMAKKNEKELEIQLENATQNNIRELKKVEGKLNLEKIKLDGEIADRKERTDIERTKRQNEHEARIKEITNKHKNDKIELDFKAEEVRGKQNNESKQIDYNHK